MHLSHNGCHCQSFGPAHQGGGDAARAHADAMFAAVQQTATAAREGATPGSLVPPMVSAISASAAAHRGLIAFLVRQRIPCTNVLMCHQRSRSTEWVRGGAGLVGNRANPHDGPLSESCPTDRSPQIPGTAEIWAARGLRLAAGRMRFYIYYFL